MKKVWLKILIIIILFSIAFSVSEVGAYIWHRFIAHNPLFFPIRETHRIHHVDDLDDKAHEDFYWIVLGLAALGIIVLGLLLMRFPSYIIIPVYLGIVVFFCINWYIHSMYHTDNCWLEQFEVFRKLREIHFQHHKNPRSNYSIVTSIPDRILGSYEKPNHKLSLKNPNNQNYDIDLE